MSESDIGGVSEDVIMEIVHLSESSLLGGRQTPKESQSVKFSVCGLKDPAQSLTADIFAPDGNRREHTPIERCLTLTVTKLSSGSGGTLALLAR